ncbi:MAG: hypothetical protein IPM18_16390 [Phycisphaerales bacterium]|nr:hypothetical protein [Phycisphaerales bacterium]
MTSVWMRTPTAASLALSLVASVLGQTSNIDLSTIPPRDTVQLTIYNSEDLTLVRETRRVTFKPGMNPLQFSWANTLIDPSSVELRFRTHADALELVDTVFPHDKPQMLYWNVRSAFDGDAEVEISYFTSGISWNADYVLITDAAEERMRVESYVTIRNHSGEDYADAEIRLVVGTINLVEKIAELARRGIISWMDADAASRPMTELLGGGRQIRIGVVVDALGRADEARERKEIVKEGLSEYFLYTIEGTETVPNGWAKRIVSFDATQVPFAIKYRYRPQEYGDYLARIFLLRNDEKSKLGTTPLPDGIVRVFRENTDSTLSFVMQVSTPYIPIGQEIVLNTGADPEVLHELVRLRTWRDKFWFKRQGFDLYYSPEEGHRIEVRDTLAGWQEHRLFADRIRNYRNKPVEVEIRRAFDGDVSFSSSLAPTLQDYRTVQFSTVIAAGEKRDLKYHVLMRMGHLAKQNRVELSAGE